VPLLDAPEYEYSNYQDDPFIIIIIMYTAAKKFKKKQGKALTTQNNMQV